MSALEIVMGAIGVTSGVRVHYDNCSVGLVNPWVARNRCGVGTRYVLRVAGRTELRIRKRAE